MRIFSLYLFFTVVLTLYEGQVCPFMEDMPPRLLLITFFSAFMAILMLRGLLQGPLVMKAPQERRPRRQFLLDYSLCLAAGALNGAYYTVIYRIPPVSVAFLMLGFFLAGFFIAVDMALARERAGIDDALSRKRVLPPNELYPMTRKFSWVAVVALALFSMVIFLVINRDLAWLSGVGGKAAVGMGPGPGLMARQFARASRSAMVEVFFIMAVLLVMVVNLILSYSKNLRILFDNETKVLERVAGGDLSRFVPVATNDEFGVIAGYTNTMIHGLKHRSKLLNELELAREVQQNLLPGEPPERPGLDIAGASRFCTQTGGDYFDYLDLPGGRLGIVIGDATDHGVGAALHMATARAVFRGTALSPISPAETVTRANRLLTRDTYETSRFMTLFYLVLDTEKRSAVWVRAGHEPALVYDPGTGEFTELVGPGPALSLSPDFAYEENLWEDIPDNAVLVLYTDGVTEAHNPGARMLGKEPVKRVVKENAEKSAYEILSAVLSLTGAFREGGEPEDDETLVVVKFAPREPAS